MAWIPGIEDVSTSLVFVTVFLFVLSFIKRDKLNIPGPFSLPIIGNSLQMMATPITDVNEMMDRLSQKYGNIFRLNIGGFLFVCISGYDNLHNAFVKNGHVFSDRPSNIPSIRNGGASRGVLWSSGNYWKKVRRFTLQTMRDFGVGKRSLEGIILEETKNIDAVFEKHQGQPINTVKETMTAGVSNVIHSVVFGFRHSHDNKTFCELLAGLATLVKSSSFLSVNFTLPLWMRLLTSPKKAWELIQFRNNIRDYVVAQKQEHMTSFDENNIRDFIDLHIKNERSKIDESYDDETMISIIVNLFNAGTETTATTLDWSLLYMIAFPDIQRKCYEEISTGVFWMEIVLIDLVSITKSLNHIQAVGDGRMVNMSDRSKLVYVEATLMEIQRVANTLTTTLPHMASEDATLNGYHIPKGTVLLGLLYTAHYDPKYWKDPHKFNPERFIDADGKLIKKDSFVPFSLGPRVCLGESLAKMELFLIFSNLIQRYKFCKVDDSDVLSFKGVSGVTTSAPPYRLTANLR